MDSTKARSVNILNKLLVIQVEHEDKNIFVNYY